MQMVDGDPQYSRDTRIRIALAKFHGIDGEEWSKKEIAEFLNVSRSTVNEYLNETQMAAEAEHALVEKEAQIRLQLIQDLRAKMDRLDKLEEQYEQEVEAVPTRFEVKRNVKGQVDLEDVPNVEAPEDGATASVEMDIPVPDRFKEVPKVEKLERVWREKRMVQEQLEDLLGLESPDELDVTEDRVVDVKLYRTNEDLPEQEVIDVTPSEHSAELPEQPEGE